MRLGSERNANPESINAFLISVISLEKNTISKKFEKMKYIDTWLTGLGLEYVIPKLKTNGITTPKKLASLSLREIYEVVGVEDSEDRKKLFFLIQRLQTVRHFSSSNLGFIASNRFCTIKMKRRVIKLRFRPLIEKLY